MIKHRIAKLEKDSQTPEPPAVALYYPDSEPEEEAVARHIAEFGSEPDRLILLECHGSHDSI